MLKFDEEKAADMTKENTSARALLLEELKCAESVRAGAVEIQRLLERGAIEQAEEILARRGKVIHRMTVIDSQLRIMSEQGLLGPSSPHWNEMVGLAKSLCDVTQTIVKVDAGTRGQLERKGKEISVRLNHLLDGKKAMKGYHRKQQTERAEINM